MKFLFSNIAMIALIAAASAAPASAARIGGLQPVGPTPYVPGEWRARVKYVDPHPGRDGQYHTFSYLDITAQTQEGCENQLSSLGSVSVIDYCHFVPY